MNTKWKKITSYDIIVYHVVMIKVITVKHNITEVIFLAEGLLYLWATDGHQAAWQINDSPQHNNLYLWQWETHDHGIHSNQYIPSGYQL